MKLCPLVDLFSTRHFFDTSFRCTYIIFTEHYNDYQSYVPSSDISGYRDVAYMQMHHESENAINV